MSLWGRERAKWGIELVLQLVHRAKPKSKLLYSRYDRECGRVERRVCSCRAPVTDSGLGYLFHHACCDGNSHVELSMTFRRVGRLGVIDIDSRHWLVRQSAEDEAHASSFFIADRRTCE